MSATPNRARFPLESLADLRAGLCARGGDLAVRHGRPEAAAIRLATQTGAREMQRRRPPAGADAVTVWAAYANLVRADALPKPPTAARHRREPMRTTRQAIGPDRTQAAEQRGTAMTLATAVEFATMVTVTDPRRPQSPGGESLSPREQELLRLVGQGRTDTQIAEQLFISVHTVRSHLDRIRDKTGCRRRADLTRFALHADLA